jgi:hypothetical protein
MNTIKVGSRFINLDMLVEAEARPDATLDLVMAVTAGGPAPGSLRTYRIVLGGAEAAAVLGHLERESLDLLPPAPEEG